MNQTNFKLSPAVKLIALLVLGALLFGAGYGLRAFLEDDVAEFQTQGISIPGVPRTRVTGQLIADLLTVNSLSEFTGAADFASTLQFGTDNLYTLGHASSGKQLVCGTTGTFTATTALDLSGSLTTVDAILVSQITDAASTGAFVTATDPTTTTVTVKSWEADATAGTTGVDVHYCAVGGQ